MNENLPNDSVPSLSLASQQLHRLIWSAHLRIAGFLFGLVLLVGALYAIGYILTWSPDSQREIDIEAENLFLDKYGRALAEKNLATSFGDVVEPEVLRSVKEYATSLLEGIQKDKLINELGVLEWRGGVATGRFSREPQRFSIALTLKDAWNAKRDVALPNFYRFQKGSVGQLTPERLDYVMGENSLLDTKVRDLMGYGPTGEVSPGVVANPAVIKLLLKELMSASLEQTLTQGITRYSRELLSQIDQNEKSFKALNSSINELRTEHDDRINKALQAPILPERYGRIVQRSSLSFVLVIIAVTLLFRIKSEIVLLTKLRSAMVLSQAFNMEPKNGDLFDAVDRLHSEKTDHRDEASQEFIKKLMDFMKK